MAVSERVLERQQSEEAARQRFASTLRHARTHFHLSNVRLGQATGLPTSTVRTKFEGESPTLAHEVEWFAAAFGIPVEVLHMAPADAVAWMEENRPDRQAPLTRAIGGYFATSAAA